MCLSLSPLASAESCSRVKASTCWSPSQRSGADSLSACSAALSTTFPECRPHSLRPASCSFKSKRRHNACNMPLISTHPPFKYHVELQKSTNALQLLCTVPHLPPPTPLTLVLVGQHCSCAWLASDGDVPASMQLIRGHALQQDNTRAQ